MKYLFIYLFFMTFIVGCAIGAQEASEGSTEPQAVPESQVDQKARPDQNIILQPGFPSRLPPSEIRVESGSDMIIGDPEESVEAAHRSWKTACKAWKDDLQRLNRGNLMIRSCGQPRRRSEKVQLKTLFTVESKATYKIKLGCE